MNVGVVHASTVVSATTKWMATGAHVLEATLELTVRQVGSEFMQSASCDKHCVQCMQSINKIISTLPYCDNKI